MAAPSGQQDKPKKEKKEVTPEQRKIYTQLGVIGVLALVAGVMYLPGMLSGGSTPDLPEAPPSTAETAANNAVTPPEGGAGAADGAKPETAAAATAPVVQAAVAQPLARYRSDPFQQPYFIPTPTPVPPPLPLPVGIPSPFQISPIALPGGGGGASQSASQPLNLPQVRINRLDETVRRPTDAFPPRRTVGAGGNSGGVPSPSSDKRLSGVIIADGVRALLEIQGPGGPVTRVVQPGDEVDGITVLSIQRFNDGTRTVTRMLIRENGEERSVELRAAPQQAAAAGGGA